MPLTIRTMVSITWLRNQYILKHGANRCGCQPAKTLDESQADEDDEDQMV